MVRDTCREIGFTSEDVGLNCDTCKVLVHIEEQSPDIGQVRSGHGWQGRAHCGARITTRLGASRCSCCDWVRGGRLRSL